MSRAVSKPVWVSRDDYSGIVEVWEEKPMCRHGIHEGQGGAERIDSGYYETFQIAGLTLNPGECKEWVFDGHDASEPTRAELVAALEAARIELGWIIQQQNCRKGGSVHVAYDNVKKVLAKAKGGEA